MTNAAAGIGLGVESKRIAAATIESRAQHTHVWPAHPPSVSYTSGIDLTWPVNGS